MSESHSTHTTIEHVAAEPSAISVSDCAALVVQSVAGLSMRELRPGEAVTVGRRWPADLVIEDLSLSRCHARFLWRDGELWVEDLGSRNGVMQGGQRVSSARLRSGSLVALGGVCISAHIVSSAHALLAGFDGYDVWRAYLQEEVERASALDDEFSVISVRRVAGSGEAWCLHLRRYLRAFDRVALLRGERLLALLPGSTSSAARALCEELRAALPHEALAIGLASSPEHGSADGLLQAALRACDSASVTQPIVCASQAQGEPRHTLDIVQDPVMQGVRAFAQRAARTTAPVLISGETGTGKELLAQLVHDASGRSGPLKVLNCGAIPETLLTSLLFGHVKGAFTGADRAAPGLFRQAEGGTVFLDEVGELPPVAQAALLRVLETRRVTPVGGRNEEPVDFRLIAATHRDLEQMASDGRFRSDLLYRLNTVVLEIPPLRLRGAELLPLAQHFLHEASRAWRGNATALHPETQALLQSYAWPGNIRELRNVMEHAAIAADSALVLPSHLPARVVAASAQRDALVAVTTQVQTVDGELALQDRVRRYETEIILAALQAAEGSVTRAAERLRLPVRTLAYKMRAHGIKREDGGACQ
jgi:two-component system response regulator AtoC